MPEYVTTWPPRESVVGVTVTLAHGDGSASSWSVPAAPVSLMVAGASSAPKATR
jgi:hypothetical protein